MAAESSEVDRADPHSLWNVDNPRMHVGTQRFDTTDEHLAFLGRLGVNSMAANDITFDRERGWDADELAEKREKCRRYGVDLEMVALPLHQFNDDGGSDAQLYAGKLEKGREGDRPRLQNGAGDGRCRHSGNQVFPV